MRRILILWLAASVGWAWPAVAEVPVYKLVKEKSFIRFYAIQNGAPVEGAFSDFTTDIRFSPDDLKHSSIIGEVNTGSVTSANDDVEKNLKLPEWFSVGAFPVAHYKTKTITRTPQSDDYFADGELTIRGKTLPVEITFQLKPYGDRYIAEGSMTVHRLAFGVGQGAWAKDDVIKDEVKVEFRITADKQ